ncbi:Ferric iron reductase protein FhuF, involved in iron transport [Halopseudomonas xinjiangensis]|uniref:Ferric iron reductase protein FhuF, involved in iron transport n=1 Tax=Halopseudomonas xinjiangensis TaxID=487184 RepID=A0A1H1SUJ8_9GAMM|nr:(2Fe-2S)-binding protein [Halopseudomonas xinjiangensis]SDS51513.1 Ferric iron reductase protein FhuF, involved in iron transport [Halopseudomonas xinjiangensis]
MNRSGLGALASVDSWRGHYWQHLEQDGLDPELILSQALAAQHPYDGPSKLFSLAECVETPDLLAAQVRQNYPGACTAKLQRAYHSVIHQDLALSLIAPLALKLFRDGHVALPTASQIFVVRTQHDGQTQLHWFMETGQTDVDEQDFIACMSELTSDWYPFFRRGLGVSPGSYWSSVGLALGAPFAAVWNLAQPGPTCRLAQRWLEAFRNDANAFVDWIPVTFGEQQTAIPQRRGCCLAYLLPDSGHCGTCGVHRKQRIQAACLNQPYGCAK